MANLPYRASCFTFTVAGLHTIYKAAAIEQHTAPCCEVRAAPAQPHAQTRTLRFCPDYGRPCAARRDAAAQNQVCGRVVTCCHGGGAAQGWIPWRAYGLSIALNGFVSYMGDVEAWGRESRWKDVDILLASCNMVFALFLLLLEYVGPMSFPSEPPIAFAIGILASVLCKRKAVWALDHGDRDGFIFWHTGWHTFLPLGAVVAQLLLPS